MRHDGRLRRIEERAPEAEAEPVTIVIRWQGDDTIVTEAELADGLIVPGSPPMRVVRHEPPNYEVRWNVHEPE